MNAGQDAFRAALLDPAAPPPAGLTDGHGGPAGRRFDVYRNNVTASLADALATAFPAIAAALGAERFRALAVAHLRAHPPRSPMLMHVGAELPAFLEGFQPLARHPWLADLARLELALRESYHAADATPLPADALAALPPERLAAARLGLAPALRLVPSRWPLVSLRRAALEGGAMPPAGAPAEHALVTRPGFDPQVAALDADAGDFVAALAAGETLGTAAARAADAAPGFDPGPPISALLAGGAVIALHEEPSP
jgi:hypothetical protein